MIKQTATSSTRPGLLTLLKALELSKRQKIIIATILLTLSLAISSQTSNFIFLKARLIIGLGVVAYFLSLWALWEGMTKTKALLLLVLPTFYTIAVASFYFLLPVRWLTRIPTDIFFGLSFYCLLLAENVFNVASIRTIPLYRAASTAAFIFTVITSFFLFNDMYALNWPFYWNGVVAFLISLPLVLHILWTIEMERISFSLVVYSLLIALQIGECAIALSFWPVAPTIWSLFLSTMLYVLLGVMTEFIRNRLTKRVSLEYVSVGIIVTAFSMLATSWTG